MYAKHLDADSVRAAIRCCRGSYQLGIVMGTESLSGATLRGDAAKWGGRYRESRHALLMRMTEAGVVWSEERGAHGKRILVIGMEVAS